MADYILANPSGNITALVESPVPDDKRRLTAAAIMAAEPSAEQLGFLSPGKNGADISLYMAGGEFCGNACLSAAAWLLRLRGEDRALVKVDISGAESAVAVEIERKTEGVYAGYVNMPLPLSIERKEGVTLVNFPGISHAVLDAPISKAEAEAMIIPLCENLGVEALGLMLFDRESSRLRPLVYVPGAGSLFWETSCASGSAAVAAALAEREGHSLSLSLSQPGGTLSIDLQYESGKIRSLRLGGQVILPPMKKAEI